MKEKMLITQALDERDFLRKKILDKIQAFQAAIVASNATTKITTSYGVFTVAAAIAMKNRLITFPEPGNASFEDALIHKMQHDYDRCMVEINDKNLILDETAENMRLSILGKDVKVKDDKPLAVVDYYLKENQAELADPLESLQGWRR